MLAEALAWLLTPASLAARRTGQLNESIAIAARHRRCRAAWAPHLAASRQALLDSATAAPGRRIALVLGSGHLLDVPLAELTALFEAVWLVDVVHPWPARWVARRHGNVRLIERDLTQCPDLFLDVAGIDWVASVNLLSQLGAEAPMADHLAWLGRFQAPVCLLADLEQTCLDGHGEVTGTTDYRPLLAGWRIRSEWRWDLAPPGELAGGGSAWHRVAALTRHGHDEHQGDVG